MKKISTLFIFCMLALAGYAGPVSRGQALQIAQSYLQKNHVTRTSPEPSTTLTLAYECLSKSTRSQGVTDPLYYVFNQGSHDGFIVIAGDDRMTPVLGVVDSGHFELKNVHDGMQWWLQAMETTMLQVVQSAETEVQPMPAAADLKPSVAPLVHVNWGQDSPYNDACPYDSVHQEQSLVGCAAVALAQVLSKWEYPLKGSGQVDYVTSQHHLPLKADLSTFTFDWNKMLPDYNNGKGTAEERKAVATLMYACGLAVDMDYCSIASGASISAVDLEDHFGIASTCNDVERLYFTRAEWDHLIKSELSAGRPVIYNGYSRQAGHSFVCDGYNQEGLFHINWGWDGSLNGYFALAELNSAVEYAGAPTETEGSFNLDQSVVYGIQPKESTVEKENRMLYFTTMNEPQASSPKNVKVNIVFVRADGNGFTGSMGLGLYDKSGQFVGCVGNQMEVALKPGYLYENLLLGGSLPKDMKDGIYTLCPVFQHTDGHFEKMSGRKGSGYVNYMTLTLKQNHVDLKMPELIDADFKLLSAQPISDKVYAGVKNVLEIKLRNDGAMYNGPISLVRINADNRYSIAYDNNYIVEQGEEVVIRAKVEAPEGLSSDSLEIWIAKYDDDLFYQNNYFEKVVGKFGYALSEPTKGAPDFLLKRFVIKNKKAHLEDHLDVDVTLINRGGFYNNDFYCFIFPKQGGTSLASMKKAIVMDKGDTLSMNLQVPIEDLEDGEYFLYPYYVYGGEYQEMTETRYYFSKSKTGTFQISNLEGYGYSCFDYAFVVPEGMECGVVTAADRVDWTIDYRYTPGDVVPAGTSIVFKVANKGNYVYDIVYSEETAPKDNLLTNQTDEKGYTYAGEGDFLYYRFSSGEAGSHYGFYLAANDGKPFKLAEGKCYLPLPKNNAKLTGYAFDGFETGIEGVGADVTTDGSIYTLSGVRVSASFDQLPRGIYIVNGRKVVR